MNIDPHDLHHDFPEHKERIHDLKLSDEHFAKMFEAYDVLVHQVRHIEQDGSKIGDADLEKMKYDRLHLKDRLYAYLNKPA